MTTSSLSIIHPHTGTGRSVATVVVAWFTAAAWASVTNLPALTPWMLPLCVATPIALFTLSWFSSVTFRDWALALDQRFLIQLHTMRMLGLGFVMLYFYDVLPAGFALAAGLGDATAAIWGLFLAAALYQGTQVGRKAIFNWNTFGVMDFIVAVGLGLVSRAYPIGLITDGPTAEPMGLFPLSLVPMFGVPLFLMTHLIIYAQLRRDR